MQHEHNLLSKRTLLRAPLNMPCQTSLGWYLTILEGRAKCCHPDDRASGQKTLLCVILEDDYKWVGLKEWLGFNVILRPNSNPQNTLSTFFIAIFELLFIQERSRTLQGGVSFAGTPWSHSHSFCGSKKCHWNNSLHPLCIVVGADFWESDICTCKKKQKTDTW